MLGLARAERKASRFVKDNLAASLLLAVGVGILVGYFIRRGSD